MRAPYDWAERFNQHVRSHLLEQDHLSLMHYEQLGEAARQSGPDARALLALLTSQPFSATASRFQSQSTASRAAASACCPR
jgi:hypothetical protein